MSGHNRKKNAPFSGTKSKFGDMLNNAKSFVQGSVPSFSDYIKQNPPDPSIFQRGNGSVANWAKNNKGYFNDSIAQFFDTLLNKGGNSMDALLNMLGNQSEWDEEFLSQFFQYTLQHGLNADQRAYDRELTKDQRAFDTAWRDNQRLYDSPLNQLQRLMGAGIGRDAAIQILSGSAGNAAGSGSSPVVGSAAAAPSTSGTPGTFELQRALGITNAVISGVTELMNAGLSLSQGIETVRGMRMQNQMSQLQLSAYNSANDLVNQLSASGLDLSQYSNADDLIKGLQDMATNNDATAQSILNSSSYSGTFGSLAGRDFFNNFWKSVRESRDSGTLADEYIEQNKLDNSIRRLEGKRIIVDTEKLSAETMFVRAETEECFARICLTETQTAYTESQTDLVGVQSDYYRSMTELVDEQAQGQRWTNEQLRMEYELNKAGFPILKQNYIDQLQDEFFHWSLLKNPSVRQARMKRWLEEEGNKNRLAYLEALRTTATSDFVRDNQDLYELSVGIHTLLNRDLGSKDLDNAIGGFLSPLKSKTVRNAALRFVTTIP